MDAAFTEFMKDLEEGDGEIRGLRTGFRELDNVLLGMEPGDLVYMAGRPGMGKTAGALQIADQIADQGEYVPFVTIEMTPKQLFQRRVARTTKIPLGRLKRPKDLTPEDYGKLTGFTGQLIKEGLEFEDCASLDILQFKSMARKFVKEKGAKIIFLDYIQLMTVPGITDSVASLTEISRQLKSIAKELNVVIFVLSQLKRPAPNKAVEPPTLTDFKGSGGIEQDADKAILMHRYDYYNEEDRPGLCEFIVAKNRSGGLDVVATFFEGQFLLFKEGYSELPDIDEGDVHLQGVRSIGEAGQKDFNFTK
jgi:replicative DNA helicase